MVPIELYQSPFPKQVSSCAPPMGAKRNVRAAFMSYVRERGTNVGFRKDGETKMREIDGSDETRKRVKERQREEERNREREVRVEDVEIKRGTEEDCERGEGGGRQRGKRGRVKWVHLRSVKQSGLRIEPGSGPA